MGRCEHYDCDLRNNAGYCKLTVCVNQKYNRFSEHVANAARYFTQQELLLDFANWVAKEVIDDDNWARNNMSFQEIACRKLAKIGIIQEKDGKYIYEEMKK